MDPLLTALNARGLLGSGLCAVLVLVLVLGVGVPIGIQAGSRNIGGGLRPPLATTGWTTTFEGEGEALKDRGCVGGGPGLNTRGGGVQLPALVLEISPSSAAGMEVVDSSTSCLACLVSTFFAGGIGTNLFSVRSASSLEDLSSFCFFLRIAKSFRDIFIFTLGDSASSSGGGGGGGGGSVDGEGGCGGDVGDGDFGVGSTSGGGGDGDLGVGSTGGDGDLGVGSTGGDGDLGVGSTGGDGDLGSTRGDGDLGSIGGDGDLGSTSGVGSGSGAVADIRESWAKDEKGEVVDEPVQYQSLAICKLLSMIRRRIREDWETSHQTHQQKRMDLGRRTTTSIPRTKGSNSERNSTSHSSR